MGDVNISYEHIEKTPAIDDYVRSKISKIEKFLHEEAKIFVNIIDLTPKKKTGTNEYKIKIDVKDFGAGRNSNFIVNHTHKDLYASIDEIVDKVSEKLRRSHEKKSRHFTDFKDKLIHNYLNFSKKQTV